MRILVIPDAIYYRSCGLLSDRPPHYWRHGIHVRSRPAAVHPPAEPVSRGDSAAAAVGNLAAGLRPARLAAADADRVDRGADQLLLASRDGCELGSGTIFPSAARHAG